MWSVYTFSLDNSFGVRVCTCARVAVCLCMCERRRHCQSAVSHVRGFVVIIALWRRAQQDQNPLRAASSTVFCFWRVTGEGGNVCVMYSIYAKGIYMYRDLFDRRSKHVYKESSES